MAGQNETTRLASVETEPSQTKEGRGGGGWKIFPEAPSINQEKEKKNELFGNADIHLGYTCQWTDARSPIPSSAGE